MRRDRHSATPAPKTPEIPRPPADNPRTPVFALVDYGSGNLRSVTKALEACGARVERIVSPDGLSGADAVVVPGVGSFGDCAARLDAAGLRAPLLDWLRSGKPYLGICLGYQLLFSSSEESPGAQGLGFFPGRVVKFPRRDLKIPHMGWNTLSETRGALFHDLPENPWFYFVHSYYPEPADPGIVSARCNYGVSFAAAVSAGPIHAAQFHPEKSQSAGLALLRGFVHALNAP